MRESATGCVMWLLTDFKMEPLGESWQEISGMKSTLSKWIEDGVQRNVVELCSKSGLRNTQVVPHTKSS